MALLEIQNLVKHFPISGGGLFPVKSRRLKAVDDITLSVEKGTSFGLAGESGSGKTTVAKLILLQEGEDPVLPFFFHPGIVSEFYNHRDIG